MVLAGLALVVGLLLGLLGGGGSILTVPLLVLVVGLEPRQAVATSLVVVGAASGAAVGVHASRGRVRWGVAASFGLASMVGAFGGGRLAHRLPSQLLLGVFAALMVVTGLAMLRPRAGGEAAAPRSPGSTGAIGVTVGLVTGLVGAGGGFVVVPALVMLGGLGMGEAVATSLAVVTMNSLAGLAGQIAHVTIDPAVAAPATLAAALGSAAGAGLSGLVPAVTLRRSFACLVLAVACSMGWHLHSPGPPPSPPCAAGRGV